MDSSRIRASLLLIILSVTLVGLCAAPAHAQRIDGAVGAGGQIGEPTGVTVKFFNDPGPSYDILAAWSLTGDRSFFLSGHALWNRDLTIENVNRDLEWFYGPGAFLLIEEDDDGLGNDEDEAVFGVSGTVGLNFILNERVEFFIQATPRLSLAPDTDGDIGGGIGVRYYF